MNIPSSSFEEVSEPLATQALDANMDHTTVSHYPDLQLLQIQAGLRPIAAAWQSENIDLTNPDAVAEHKAAMRQMNYISTKVEDELERRRMISDEISEDEGN